LLFVLLDRPPGFSLPVAGTPHSCRDMPARTILLLFH
jgi:hypothetical protein